MPAGARLSNRGCGGRCDAKPVRTSLYHRTALIMGTRAEQSRPRKISTYFDILAQNEEHLLHTGAVRRSIRRLVQQRLGLRWVQRAVCHQGAVV